MRFELFVAWRYLVARRGERFIYMVSAISVLGVAVGVACLIVVLSVMAGFDNDLKEKIVGANPHIIIEKAGGMPDIDPVIDQVRKISGVRGASPYIIGQVILTSSGRPLEGLKADGRTIGAMMKGIDADTEPDVTKIKEYIVKGRLPRQPKDIVIGRELADILHLGIGSTLGVISPVDGKRYDFTVKGLFACGMYDYDSSFVFTGIEDAQQVFVMPDDVSGVGIKLKDAWKADEFAGALRKKLNYMYTLRSWTNLNSNLFSALKLEKATMFIILTLIVIVACFNIASTLMMMVLEKTKDIGILKAIGATNPMVRFIFTLEGFIIGFLGTVLGLGLGIGLCGLLKKYQFVQLPREIYYIDHLPVQIKWSDSVLIVIAAVLISLAATVYPAWQASRLDPVEALRYE